MTGQRNSYGKRSGSHSDYNDDRRTKRRYNGDDRLKIFINSDDTVYRYLCPSKKIGSIMGRGGDIVKKIRSDTNSKVRIGETVTGCDERVITIYSMSEETNEFDDGERVCPALEALFKVHDRVVDEMDDEKDEEVVQVTARLLVSSDQIGCVIGKGGQVVQTIRTDTGAQIRIMKDRNMPTCALTSDELLQVSGEVSRVRKALFQIASRLHDNPSRSQHLLDSSTTNMYTSGDSVMRTAAGAPIMSLSSLVGSYDGGYKGESRDWPHGVYPAPRGGASSKDFLLRIICPTANVGGVIGKGGATINQIRQESGATVNVDSSKAEGDDCIISISAKEFFEEAISPTIEAAIRLQPRCSERIERDSGLISYTTRLLVPTSQVGCLIGKGGAKISEMRRITKANIRILSKENVPKIADPDDEMVQITAELDLAKDALIQVAIRLRGDLFEREGAMSTFVPVLPYLPVAPEAPEYPAYERRDSKGRGHDHSYPGRYDASSDLPRNDGYRNYDSFQGRGSGDAYGAYGSYSEGRSGYSAGRSGYSAGRSGHSGGSRHSPPSRRRDHGY